MVRTRYAKIDIEFFSRLSTRLNSVQSWVSQAYYPEGRPSTDRIVQWELAQVRDGISGNDVTHLTTERREAGVWRRRLDSVA
ncbi:hypothetical protein PISMIDRAFT_573077 [Pisolithus microcarpus 441]|uniref:Uncharacterized protein n=1 Tax=Pisolithus microcarpus 441 TaxID=765257 RepID=A0A0C9ZLQ6_9AGAM|nr:hypothetical protein PISMIDRAFT_573077 [Pisolithus microcarpus 441]